MVGEKKITFYWQLHSKLKGFLSRTSPCLLFSSFQTESLWRIRKRNIDYYYYQYYQLHICFSIFAASLPVSRWDVLKFSYYQVSLVNSNRLFFKSKFNRDANFPLSIPLKTMQYFHTDVYTYFLQLNPSSRWFLLFLNIILWNYSIFTKNFYLIMDNF